MTCIGEAYLVKVEVGFERERETELRTRVTSGHPALFLLIFG